MGRKRGQCLKSVLHDSVGLVWVGGVEGIGRGICGGDDGGGVGGTSRRTGMGDGEGVMGKGFSWKGTLTGQREREIQIDWVLIW